MKIRPHDDVIVVTNNPKIKNVAKLYAQNIRFIKANIDSEMPIETVWKIINENSTTIFGDNNSIAAVYVSKYVKEPRANSMSLFNKDGFIKSKN